MASRKAFIMASPSWPCFSTMIFLTSGMVGVAELDQLLGGEGIDFHVLAEARQTAVGSLDGAADPRPATIPDFTPLATTFFSAALRPL